MKFPEIFVVKKKKSPLKIILIIVGAVVAAVAAIAVVYKLWGEKLLKAKKVIGEVDLNGDGEADAVMLDTTGNGEVDTIIIQADIEE